MADELFSEAYETERGGIASLVERDGVAIIALRTPCADGARTDTIAIHRSTAVALHRLLESYLDHTAETQTSEGPFTVQWSYDGNKWFSYGADTVTEDEARAVFDLLTGWYYANYYRVIDVFGTTVLESKATTRRHISTTVRG